ncbi:hypothetical protein, partial [uncultured Oscillibacter sp.]|uniref:hypothetical protein n=1 Tax=uncultured Oscillibacter sp. TaxID=876091 RepID=UPI00261CBD8E
FSSPLYRHYKAQKIIREVFAESLDFTGFSLLFSDYFSPQIMRPSFRQGFYTPMPCKKLNSQSASFPDAGILLV